MVARIGLARHRCFHLLSVDNVKNLLGGFCCKRFKDDKIFVWLLHVYDIHYLVVVGNLEWEVLLAQFAVKLLKLEHELLLVYLARDLGVKPSAQTLQMDLTHGAGAVTW